LRRLPIPKLEESCKRFLLAFEAIYSKNETIEMKGLINKFIDSDGYALHKALKDYDRHNPFTSYIVYFFLFFSVMLYFPIFKLDLFFKIYKKNFFLCSFKSY
jgi:hypothetical protein